MERCIINAIHIPTVAEMQAQGTKPAMPYILLRWPKGKKLPVHIQQEVDAYRAKTGKHVNSTCNLNLSWTGGAVSKLTEIRDNMKNGLKYSIGIDFDPEICRVTGGDKTQPYIQLDPTAVYLNKIEELEPVWIGAKGTTEDDELAKQLNAHVNAVIEARTKLREVTQSGTVIFDDGASKEDDTIASNDDSVFE